MPTCEVRTLPHHDAEAVAVKEGWEIVERFVDKGISGAKGLLLNPNSYTVSGWMKHMVIRHHSDGQSL